MEPEAGSPATLWVDLMCVYVARVLQNRCSLALARWMGDLESLLLRVPVLTTQRRALEGRRFVSGFIYAWICVSVMLISSSTGVLL